MTSQHHTSNHEPHSMSGLILTDQYREAAVRIVQRRAGAWHLVLFGSFMTVAALLPLLMAASSPDSPAMQNDGLVPPVVLWFSGLLILSVALVIWGVRRLRTTNRQRRALEQSFALPGQHMRSEPYRDSTTGGGKR